MGVYKVLIVAFACALGVACSRATEPAPAAATGLDSVVASDAAVEKIASGYKFLEGPLWRTSPAGSLWFSDLVGNVVYEWLPDGKTREVLKPGGYDGTDAPPGAYIGPNGMVMGPDGSVMLTQHGNRRIARIAPDGQITTLVDRFEGKRLNSPNDLVYAPDGALYFTDPPFGLPKVNDDPGKELPFNGVYRLSGGTLQAVIRDIALPNGIAFSPDYKTLYVANSEANRRLWMRYDVNADGSVSNGRVFADATSSKDEGVPDGLKVDSAGNVYAAGPGGVWVFSAAGTHLGTIKTPETPANCAWGDDGKTLYITAVTGLYKVRTKIPGMKAVYN
jgi:gluconolactonase